MSTIHFHAVTTSTPEQFIAGLTDFGPDRSQIFTKSADSYLTVHSQGRGHADVTEGSGGVWERLQYDWSDPGQVKPQDHQLQLVWRRSGYTYTMRQPDGQPTSTSYRSPGQEHQGACAVWGAGNCWQGGAA